MAMGLVCISKWCHDSISKVRVPLKKKQWQAEKLQVLPGFQPCPGDFLTGLPLWLGPPYLYGIDWIYQFTILHKCPPGTPGTLPFVSTRGRAWVFQGILLSLTSAIIRWYYTLCSQEILPNSRLSPQMTTPITIFQYVNYFRIPMYQSPRSQTFIISNVKAGIKLAIHISPILY